MGLLFILLMVSFAVQRLLSLIYHLFIFTFLLPWGIDICLHSGNTRGSCLKVFKPFLVYFWTMEGSIVTSLIYLQLSSFPNTNCWRDCLFAIVYSCLLCQRLVVHRCVGLFQGSLFCCIGLYVCFCANIMLIWLPELCSIVRSLGGFASSFVLLPQDFLGNSGSFVVPHKF